MILRRYHKEWANLQLAGAWNRKLAHPPRCLRQDGHPYPALPIPRRKPASRPLATQEGPLHLLLVGRPAILDGVKASLPRALVPLSHLSFYTKLRDCKSQRLQMLGSETKASGNLGGLGCFRVASLIRCIRIGRYPMCLLNTRLPQLHQPIFQGGSCIQFTNSNSKIPAARNLIIRKPRLYCRIGKLAQNAEAQMPSGHGKKQALIFGCSTLGIRTLQNPSPKNEEKGRNPRATAEMIA